VQICAALLHAGAAQLTLMATGARAAEGWSSRCRGHGWWWLRRRVRAGAGPGAGPGGFGQKVPVCMGEAKLKGTFASAGGF